MVMILYIYLCTVTSYLYAQDSVSSQSDGAGHEDRSELISDTLGLSDVFVFGKTKSQMLREGNYSVTAIDIKDVATSVTNLSEFISRSSGIKLRVEGGFGSENNLSINGMSSNSIRYFVDGVPLSSLGTGIDLSNFPLNSIDRIEVYKGVVPAYLGGDALGGAINIITKAESRNFLEASLSAGSFSTYRGDVKYQGSIAKDGPIIRAQFNSDYSKNDYRMHDIEVWNADSKKYENVSRRRFHDRYKSIQGQLEIGVEKRSWADQCFVGVGYTDTEKQLQTGSVQNIVIGSAEHNTSAWNIHGRYRKTHFLLPRLTAMLTFSHTWDNSVTVDTALRRYDWNGEWKATSRNEINGRARILRHYKRPMTVGRANFSYALCPGHSLTLNYLYQHTGNERYDKAHEYYPIEEVQDLPATTNDAMTKHIIGLSYDQALISNKMLNSFFVKDYVHGTYVEQEDISNVTNSLLYKGHKTKNFLGYGIGARYAFDDPFALRFSYEHAIRLPQSREMLGNGTTVYANFALKPESSDNINLGAYGTARLGKTDVISYEATGFMRITKDYIRLRLNEADGTAQYENVNDVTTRGIEAEVRYSHSYWLQFVANGSVQESLDMERWLENGNRNATYRNRVPNLPWMFGNVEMTFTNRHLFSKTDKVRLNFHYQYVHWYYLTWEGYGNKASKAKIPTQNILNASLSYSWKNELYNIALTCHNLTDRICYDNYKLQKPGRSLMLKFSIRI